MIQPTRNTTNPMMTAVELLDRKTAGHRGRDRWSEWSGRDAVVVGRWVGGHAPGAFSTQPVQRQAHRHAAGRQAVAAR